jgi:hypothetical protein
MIDLDTGTLTFGEGLQISRESSFSTLMCNPAFAGSLAKKPMNPEYPYFHFSNTTFLDRPFHLHIFFHQDRHHRTHMYWAEGNSCKKGYECSHEEAMAERKDLKRWLEKKLGVQMNYQDTPMDAYERSWGYFGPFVNIRFEDECYLMLIYK